MSSSPPEQPPTGPEFLPTEPGKSRDGLAWGGVGIGCGGYTLLFLLMTPVFSSTLLLGAGAAAYAVYFCVPAVIGIGCLFVPKLRRMGVAILIVAASVWLVAIGPCMALMNGL